ncbi:MAG: shikimate dehydrogenase [Clostridia bacterium]|nr:shikimate dehydrogenase [Clostridia bacterium]
MKYGLIGEKLGHSFSKDIHKLISDYDYQLKELTPEDFDKFIIDKDFLGVNVTIPYKKRVIELLDFVDEKALSIGAVNTVVNKNGKLYGYNTDYYGMQKLIENTGISVCGKNVAILGTGGTSHTATAVVKDLGAKTIYKVSREEKQGCIDYSQLYKLSEKINVIINTTPVGMYPNVKGKVIDLKGFNNLNGVIDAIYNPLRTQLVIDAQRKGVPAQGGLYMLVAQAVKASEYFCQTSYSEDLLDKIYKKIYLEKCNLVLTGMPSCGKTTVGGILAEKLNLEVIDTDKLIEQNSGKKVSDIFAEMGEKIFREMESKTIESISSLSGKIIATGGGAVLKDSNVDDLKRNGKIIFIDRPLEDLTPTSDRPLALNRSEIEKRYNERYDIYKRTCDNFIKADCLPEIVANKIIGELL